MVADEMPEPVGAEFRLLYDRAELRHAAAGRAAAFAERVPLLDARFFVTAVLTQRESGGNLAEVLDNLRRSSASGSRSSGRSASSRRTAASPAGCCRDAAALASALAMFVVAPEHMRRWSNDPLGIQMIVGAHRPAGARHAHHPQARRTSSTDACQTLTSLIADRVRGRRRLLAGSLAALVLSRADRRPSGAASRAWPRQRSAGGGAVGDQQVALDRHGRPDAVARRERSCRSRRRRWAGSSGGWRAPAITSPSAAVDLRAAPSWRCRSCSALAPFAVFGCVARLHRRRPRWRCVGYCVPGSGRSAAS